MRTEATFGRWLRQRRRLLDLTQSDLARWAGCSEVTIRKIEAEERVPSQQLAGSLAECLAVPAADRAAFIAFARGCSDGEELEQLPVPARRGETRQPALLPCAPTRILGREEDIAQIRQRLQDGARLLTLIGPPGIGKTRLALQVAAEGVGSEETHFIALAPVRDPALVVPTLIQALGVRQHADRAPIAALGAALRDRRTLLVLDNFEHVLGAAPQIAELLRMAPHVGVLATSRAALNIFGEQLYVVPPLGLPGPSAPPPDELLRYPTIQLFVERVRAVRPDFELTAENAPAVVEICARLDGLPLAIELAAARSRLFMPQALLSRLRGLPGPGALGMLVNGPHDLATHQRALRDTIDWSYALLDPAERLAFAHLGVFVGGFTAEAAQAVCEDGGWRMEDGEAILDLPSSIRDRLASLVNQSLLQVGPRSDGNARFTMLETLREYALEKLDASGGLPAARRRHAAYYGVAMAQMPHGPEQEQWICRLQQDVNNIRAALEWYAEHDPEAGLRCAAALRQFWFARGLLSEGRAWLGRLLAPRGSFPLEAETLALGLAAAGFLARHQGDHEQAQSLTDQSLALYRQLDDTRGCADALLNLGSIALFQASFARAEALMAESLALYQQLDDTRGIADALRVLALLAKDRGDLARAAQLGAACLALHQQIGDRHGAARTIFNLSTIAYWQGEYDRSASLAGQAAQIFEELGDQMGLAYALEGIGMVEYKQGRCGDALRSLSRSLDLLREIDEKTGTALVLHELGLVAQAQGRPQRAARLHRDGLALAWEIGDRRRTAFCLEGLAAAIGAGRPLYAAWLFGSAAALREAIGTPLPPAERVAYEHSIAAARAAADQAAFAAAWEAGHALPIQQVVDQALALSSANCTGVTS
jgi:predicted ATPase/DNA-binding XRE family transcriptional regulator